MFQKEGKACVKALRKNRLGLLRTEQCGWREEGKEEIGEVHGSHGGDLHTTEGSVDFILACCGKASEDSAVHVVLLDDK